jgi:hypothetical protein
VRQDPRGVSLLAGHHLPEAASRLHQATLFLPTSVPDPPNLNFFGPPGSGSISQRIRILLSSSKNSKKNLDSYCFVTSFGPPGSGSGSISQRYGSGSFYHQTKIVRKTLIPTVL